MAIRPGDWKARAALAAVIGAGFLVTGAGLAVMERARERRQLRQQAFVFAELSTGPIALSYRDFYEKGFYKFREQIKDRLRVDPSLKRVRIVGMDGRVLFDSDQLDQPLAAAARPPGASEPAWQGTDLEAVRKKEPTFLERAEGGGTFEIVAPFLEEWGRHAFSVAYSFDIREQLDGATHRRVLSHMLPLLAGALATFVAVLVLLRR
jgi:hypothetical protein